MGILTRFRDIMSSNINALLDKAEDPEKMIMQCLRNLHSDLGRVKSETAAIMAEEQRAKRNLDECTEGIEKMQSYAVKALEAGNENDARKFLEKKALLSAGLNELQDAYSVARTNSEHMREMHDKLVGDIDELEARKNMIRGKMAVAKTRERMNNIGSSFASANDSVSAFERMEEKADMMLDKANALAELNKSPEDDMEELAKKYENNVPGVEDELAALKAKLGK